MTTPSAPTAVGLLQRTCDCGNHAVAGSECESCRQQRLSRQHSDVDPVGEVPASVHETLSTPGQPLPPMTRAELEPRFGQDFSRVRIHTDGRAAESARAVNALAYTVAPHIVFATGQYRPGTAQGQRLLAHELAHIVQQRSGPPAGPGHLGVDAPDSAGEQEAQQAARAVTAGPKPFGGLASVAAPALARILQRACTPGAVCAAPIAGSAGDFGASETSREQAARNRRRRMSPARQRATSHVGHARQLEIFLEAQSPGLLSNIHGIFIDMDLSPGTGALTMPCHEMTPLITGAAKPCVFVHGKLNQEALTFNRTGAAMIDAIPREEWRIQTLQMLTHEVQHVLFDTAGRATPPGIISPTCTRSAISHELSELNAIISEFPTAFRAIPPGAAAADPSRTRLDNWFHHAIMGGGEDIRGILSSIGCQCECSEVDAFVIDTFNFVASSWSAAERTAFNAELRRPVWGIRWPL